MITSRRPTRRLVAAVALAATAALATVPAAAQATAPGTSGGGATWLVSVAPGQQDAARAAVARLGAQVLTSFDALDVLAVRLPAARVGDLLAVRSVLGARQDSAVAVTGRRDDRTPTRNVYREAVRSAELTSRGGTGAGVTVAVVDTGIAPVPQLAGRMVPVVGLDGTRGDCVNLSDEPTCADSYGHGTFLAGLIAGGGAHPGTSSARLLSVKLAGASGGTDTRTLLAAVQWVVAHREAHGIRVLNLSLGTPSGVSYRVDPLNYAVQRAVSAGIVVVASAGNTGPGAGTVLKPADDPAVLTVGASDDRGTPGRGDDAVPDFTAHGPTLADGLPKPDVVAPGARLVSLRSPGSTVEQAVPGGVDAVYRRGSGTSMAAAVVSGAVAQLLSLHPSWSPAQVKAALRATATGVGGQPAASVGAGLVDVAAAAAWTGTAAPDGLPAATGGEGGSTSTGWTAEDWQATNWQATNWQATNWQATNWQATNWQSADWQGSTADRSASYGRSARGAAPLGAWG